MLNNKRKKIELENEPALLSFLKRTKDGEYATIDPSSLSYARINEEREDLYGEEDYLYGMS